MYKRITFDEVKNDKEIRVYINRGNDILGELGYTDHSATHTLKVGAAASDILEKLKYDARTLELCKIAGYLHDIGNMINRHEHAQTGALLAFNLLTRMNADPEEIAIITGAIGNHDEAAGTPVGPVSAALIIADKTDVRRSRVRNNNFSSFDIHDRVNYAVESAALSVNTEEKIIMLDMAIDIQICSVMDYFEIFLTRMVMCKRAAEYLGLRFRLQANGAKLI